MPIPAYTLNHIESAGISIRLLRQFRQRLLYHLPYSTLPRNLTTFQNMIKVFRVANLYQCLYFFLEQGVVHFYILKLYV